MTKDHRLPNPDIPLVPVIPLAFSRYSRLCGLSYCQYPIDNYEFYSDLSHFTRFFSIVLSSFSIPNSVTKALSQPKWNGAMKEKMKALEKNKPLYIVDLPRYSEHVGCKWLYIVKLKLLVGAMLNVVKELSLPSLITNWFYVD